MMEQAEKTSSWSIIRKIAIQSLIGLKPILQIILGGIGSFFLGLYALFHNIIVASLLTIGVIGIILIYKVIIALSQEVAKLYEQSFQESLLEGESVTLKLPYCAEYVSVKGELDKDLTLKVLYEAKLQVLLGERVPIVSFSYIKRFFEGENPMLDKIEFFVREVPLTISCIKEVKEESVGKNRIQKQFIMKFEPPLHGEQSFIYGFKRETPYPRFFKEDIEKLRPYKSYLQDFAQWGWNTGRRPIGKLLIELRLPKIYEISEPKCHVYFGAIPRPSLAEQHSKSFHVEPSESGWILRWEIVEPVIGHRYLITWIPPSRADVKARLASQKQ